MTCPQAHFLGPFALGADDLDAEGIERHVASCPTCQSELSELSGVAALLATVQASGVDVDAAEPADYTDELLDRVLVAIGTERAAERETRRRRRRTFLLAAAATVAIAAGSVAGVTLAGRDSGTGPGTASSQVSHLAGTTRFGVSATTTIRPDPRGTMIEMALDNLPAVTSCRLVAKASDGRTDTVTSWPVTYQSSLNVHGTTSIRPADLAELQVIDNTGRRLVTVTATGH